MALLTLALLIARNAMVPQHPSEGNLIQAGQRRESIQAFFNQSCSQFWATKCLKCSLAIRKNENPFILVSPSYVFACTL